MAEKRVLVSGGSGYVAGFLIRQLVSEGWTVHTTIRNLARESTVRTSLAVDGSKVRFFAADLTNDKGWAEAMEGCSHVAHVASPFPLEVPKDPNDLIIPAREGALRALRAAKAAGVKRFVLTSSIAAIAYGHNDNSRAFTEADWTNLNDPNVQPYQQSKTIAERAARDWVAAEGGDMEFCSVNPSGIFGPVLSSDVSTSIELIKQLLEGKVPACPDIGFSVVDVRDVADLHVRALTAPNMAGERFIASCPNFLKMIDYAEVLREGLGDKARKVPTRIMPNWILKALAIVRPELKQVVSELGNVRRTDPAHAKEVLGWVPRPEKETILATANSLIDQGIVKL